MRPSDDQFVRLVATADGTAGMRWLDQYFWKIFDFLDSVDRPLSHCDAQPKNLFPAIGLDGQAETIGIDWATVGYAALGMDPANLLGSALVWLEMDVEHARQLEPEIFQTYMDSLADVGWVGSRDVVWPAYLTAAAGRAAQAAMFPVTWTGNGQWKVRQEELTGSSAEDLAAQWGETFEWMMPRLVSEAERVGVV